MESKSQISVTGKVQKLNISNVVIPQEMTNLYDYESRSLEIDTLKTSIEEFGQLEPITVLKFKGQFVITNGVLRYKAILCSNKNEINANVLDIDTDSEDFSLVDFIVHNQIQKVKTPKEKLREFISVLRLDTEDSNPLRDRNKRYDFLTSTMGKGWSRSNVILMMNVIKWTMNHGDGLKLVDQVFEDKIRVSEAAFAVEMLAREDYGYEDESESQILDKFLKGELKKERVESLVDDFKFKRNEGYTKIDVYPFKAEEYEVIHSSIEEVELPEDLEIDIVFTSPPYYKLRKYGADPNELGWEATPQLYAERLAVSLMKPYQRLKDTGSMFVNLGETYFNGECQGAIEHAVVEMKKRGMFFVDRIIWKKDSNKPISNQNHRFQPNYEVVLHFAKSKNYYFDRFRVKKDVADYKILRSCKENGSDGVNYHVPNFYKQLRTILSENELHDIVTVQTNYARIKHVEGEQYHPATFSQMLPAVFLSTFCPKPTEDYKPLVFDPFLGGASCGRTALMMGYRFSGVELYEENVETSKRILAESLQEFEPRALNHLEVDKEYQLVA